MVAFIDKWMLRFCCIIEILKINNNANHILFVELGIPFLIENSEYLQNAKLKTHELFDCK